MIATTPQNPSVQLVNNRAASNQIAEHFGKQHKDVLRAIDNLECSPEYRQRNFALTSQTVEMPKGATRQSPAYTMTRDGFVFLAMGFTGKEAAKWKEAYINAFNAMEAALHAVPALPQFITASQAGEISALINEHFPDGKDRPYAWGKLNANFRTATYKMLPASRFAEACAYIPTIPKRTTLRIDALTSVFMPPDGRYVVRIRNGRAENPMLVPDDANVMTIEQTLKLINEPNGIYISTEKLIEFVTATTKRLGQQCAHLETKSREAKQGARI